MWSYECNAITYCIPSRIVREIHLFLIKALEDIFLYSLFAGGVVSNLSQGRGGGLHITICLFQAKSVICFLIITMNLANSLEKIHLSEI